jgi:UDP-N-acetylmuramoyl-L-alanyl-D-glutamate--2,6-diaminopimelate ligase
MLIQYIKDKKDLVMKLKKIIENIDIVKLKNFKNVNIKSVSHISSEVEKNGMFICIEGNNYNGNNYISGVVKKGVKCIVTESDIEVTGCVVVVVKNIRRAMSLIAKNFYNKCCDSLRVIGIVGTSGKTTTSLMIAQLMTNAGCNVGVIGTNGIFIGNIRLDNKFTTPDPLELHYVFYQMKLMGVETVIMEVSAQAIYYEKLYGIKFKLCVFTNISQEHLDFFGSMEKYVKCKMDFFNSKNIEECIVNVDDFYGMELAYKVDVPCITFGLKNPCNAFAVDLQLNICESRFVVNILDEIVNIRCPFVGEFNVYNMLGALTVVKVLGVSCGLNSIVHKLSPIPGRFHVFEYKNSKIIVDFAHTVDSIEKLLSLIKGFSNGKIISLFGCVGYSDYEKRVCMAKVVSKYSDYVIITTDNRGDVEFEDICCDIEDGLSVD